MNYKQKRLLWLPILLGLLLVMPIIGQAVQFSDVKTDGQYGWAYEYIMEMAKKGVIKGYPDHTFNPGGSITYLECLQLLAKLRPLDAKEKSDAASSYSDLMIELKIPTWATEAVITNMINGVITESELRKAVEMEMTQNGTTKRMTRLTVSVLLARAMGLEDETKQYANLIYTDTETITARFRNHVAALIGANVLDPRGRDGKFEPFASIKRSEVSKMIKLSYDYLARNPVAPPIQESKAKGTIQTNTIIGENYSLTVKLDQDLKTFILNSKTEITLDGRKSTADQLSAGQQVEVTYDANTSRALSVHVKTAVEIIGSPAVVLEVPNAENKIVLEIEDNGQKKPITLVLDEKTTILHDGRLLAKEKLLKGDRVLYQAKEGKLTYLNRIPKETAMTGTLTELEINREKPSFITIKTPAGLSQRLLVKANAYIYRDKNLVELEQLRIGDQVAVKLEYGEAIEIDSTTDEKTVKATISGITQRINQSPEIHIEKENGDREGPYVVPKEATIKLDSEYISPQELRVGMEGKFVIDGKKISAIYLGREKTTATVHGAVTYIQGSILDVRVDYGDAPYRPGQKLTFENYGPQWISLSSGDQVEIKVSDDNGKYFIQELIKR